MEEFFFLPLAEKDLADLELWHQDIELANRYGGPQWPQRLWEIIQKDSQRKCWVIWMNGEKVGYVDFEEHVPENLAWIGLALKADMRRQGLGKRILKEFLNLPATSGFREIRAGIEHDNTASIRCFLSAGFRPLGEEPDEEGIIDYSYQRA